jgi:hypothetical protein
VSPDFALKAGLGDVALESVYHCVQGLVGRRGCMRLKLAREWRSCSTQPFRSGLGGPSVGNQRSKRLYSGLSLCNLWATRKSRWRMPSSH